MIVILPVPEMGWNVPDTLMKRIEFDQQSILDLVIPLAGYLQRNDRVLSLFHKMSQEYNDHLIFVNPADFLCDQAKKLCFGAKEGQVYYFDDDHLSNLGAKELVHLLAPLIISP